MFSKFLWLTDFKNLQILEIVQFEKLMNFFNLTLRKIIKKTLSQCLNLNLKFKF